MAKKGNVNINIGADTKKAESGIDKVTKKLNELGKSKALTTMSKLGNVTTLLKNTFSTVTSAIGSAVDTMKDLHAAALKQINAEQMLVAAAKNNPYLNSESVNGLIDYAKALRGHETDALLLMARLAGEGLQAEDILWQTAKAF